MTVLLLLGFFIVIATAHKITLLEVPRYGDPHQEAILACHYVSELDDPALHSVKWYKGSNEIFRFTPGQQPYTRTFNSTTGGVSKGLCNMKSCTISVFLPKTWNAKLSFTCEVSTEGPRFAVVKQTKNLTIAVIFKEDPHIEGFGAAQLGDEVLFNCTSSPAMPPANLMWYIDGRPETDPWVVNNTHTSAANNFGLRSSWRSLRLRVATTKSDIALRCEATVPTYPPYTRSRNTTLEITKSPHLSMFTAAGSSSTLSEATILMLVLCGLKCVYKSSALIDVIV